MKNIKRFFLNGLLLTVAALFMRLVSVGFNVYISNKVGTEGMGLFSLITGVYGLALTLATSGINLAVTRLISGAMSYNDERAKGSKVIKTMRVAVLYCTFFGFLASFLLIILSRPIGLYLLDDVRAVKPLRVFALSLPVISISSALNGYFTAMRKVYKNAIVAVIEQWCKIAFISFLLSALMPKGVEYACIALVLGGVISEFLSCALIGILWLFERRRISSDKSITASGILSSILGISIPVAASSYARSALLTIEHALIPKSLKKSGLNHARSLSLYGKIHGMALPIVLFPMAFVSSFSGLLVPEIARCSEVKNYRQIRYISSRVFQFTLIFSIGVSGLLLCFSTPLANLIYPQKEVGAYLLALAPLIPIMYLDNTTDSILKGLGYQVYSMNVNIIDSALSVVLVSILLPTFGIWGYVLLLYITELLNASLSITKLLLVTRVKVRLVRWIFAPIFCVIGASSMIRILLHEVSFSSQVFELILSMSVSALVYVILIRMIRSVSDEDAEWIGGIFKK